MSEPWYTEVRITSYLFLMYHFSPCNFSFLITEWEGLFAYATESRLETSRYQTQTI